MLTLEGITKVFGERTVIKDLSYQFPEGGTLALMGPSGSGKSTLLRLLCGLEKPDAGALTCTYRRIAVAFQEPRLLPWCRAVGNIEAVLARTEDRRERALSLLHEVELEDAAERFPSELSGGMRARLSLARALSVESDLLLLDEPFAGLDAALAARMAALIRRKAGRLTLLVTHSTKDAELLGARILRVTGEPFSALCEVPEGNE